MSFLHQLASLIRKDILVEFRLKHTMAGLVLYVLSSIFVIYYLALYQHVTLVEMPTVWMIFYWLIILFSIVHSTARSIHHESREKMMYYYSIISPIAFILSKTIYNILLTILLSLLALVLVATVLGNPLERMFPFFISILLGASGISILYTLISSITFHASGGSTLGVILGFPISIPMLVLIGKIGQESLFMVSSENWINNIVIMSAFNVVMIVMTLLLFPYIWRD